MKCTLIRVFVSSTFSDMKHERNGLAAEAFPKLEQLCQRQGFQFQAIDLRWGVSTEAGLDHRTMRICFDELRRAREISPRPNFLILLGNRYGWRPLPEEISVEEFHTLEQAAAQLPSSADKSAVVVLRDWYREDTNAVPPVYLLQSRRQDLGDNRDYTHDAVWNQVQAVLWTIINRAMPPEQLQGRFEGAAADGSPPAVVRFQASATEQEIWQGALRVPDAREHVLAFFREIENLTTFSDPQQIKDFVDVDPSGSVEVALQTELDRLKAELCQRLGSANVFRNEAPVRLVEAQDNEVGRTADVTTGHLAQLCAKVVNRLSEIIQGQFEEYWRNTAQASMDRAARELEIEQRENERFAKERGGEESFVGRQVELQAILDYVGSDSPWPFVIHGASGCGKTALLARASQEVAKSRKRIERFIGVAPRSSDLRSLLSSLCQELRQRNPRADALPTEIKQLRDEFSQHLQAATPDHPLILFLDALDQLADADNGRLLNWLPPGSLPAHVKLVVSCLSDRATDDPAGQPYAELKRRQIPAENFIKLDVLSEAEARLLLFDRWLPKAARKLSDDQRARIEQRLASPACRQPIFLKLLFEEVQLWHSYDAAPVPGESVPALLGQLFDRLCQPTNHGPLLVNRVLGYLSASRHGLAENEILEILFADPEYRAKLNEATEQTRHELPPNAKRIPIALWSRLRFDLAPYLTERAAPGANVLTFYHHQTAEWVKGHFVDVVSWGPHRRLADYFETRWAEPSLRGLDELPHQRIEAGDRVGLERALLALDFVEAKCAAGMVRQLIADFDAGERCLPPGSADSKERWQHWHQFLNEEAHNVEELVADYPEIVFQQACNQPRESCVSKMARKRVEAAVSHRVPWLDRINRPERFYPNACLRIHRHKAAHFVALHGNRAASVDENRGLEIWDLDTGSVLFRLAEPGCAVNRLVSAEGSRLVTGSAHGTVSVWDVTSGHRIFSLEEDAALRAAGKELAAGYAPVFAVARDRLYSRAGLHGREGFCVHDLANGECLASCHSPESTIRRIIPLDDGRVATLDGATLCVWEPILWKCVTVLHGPHPEGTRFEIVSKAIALSFAREVQITSANITRDSGLRVWDLESGLCRHLLGYQDERVREVTPVLSGQAICAAYAHDLVVWDVETGQLRFKVEGHGGKIDVLAHEPDGHRVICTSGTDALEVWDVESGQPVGRLQGDEMKSPVVCASDGAVLANSASHDLYLFSIESSVRLRVFRGHTAEVRLLAQAGKDHAVSVSEDGTVRLWDLLSARVRRSPEALRPRGTSPKFLTDGRAVTLSGKEIHVWDAATAKCQHRLQGHLSRVEEVLATNDGRLLSRSLDDTLRAVGSGDGRVRAHLFRSCRQDHSDAPVAESAGRKRFGRWHSARLELN